MLRIYALLLLVALSASAATAQTKKSSKARKVVLTPEQELYEELLPATAKIMFIDSVVADKESFLALLPLPADAGTLTTADGVREYVNEFNDTRLTAQGDSLARHLFIAHRYGNAWDAPRQMSEIDNLLPDYPFLMADGVTLYFSAEGEGTVGGRDIFRTNYNAEALAFYEATNAGLPYNSPANDYLLAISDVDNLGWLVTDRHQEEGQVCIYTFVPTATRAFFDEDVPIEEIKAYAELRQIKDSWAFGDYAAAVARQTALLQRLNESADESGIYFVVNDDTVYTSLDDFRTTASQEQFVALQAAQAKAVSLSTLLDTMRDSYAAAAPTKRYEIGRKIADLEAEVEALQADIAAAEKSLRANENK